MPRILPSSAVRVGETWLFATQVMSQRTSAYGAGGLDGIASIASIWASPGWSPRCRARCCAHSSPPRLPRLVRRAQSGGVGVLIEVAGDPGERSGSWFVLPLDPDSGQVGEPIPLGRRDLAGLTLSRCAPRQDGWLFDTDCGQHQRRHRRRPAQLSSIEYRLRSIPVSPASTASRRRRRAASPGRRARRLPRARRSTPTRSPSPRASGCAASEFIGRRWGFQCRPPPASEIAKVRYPPLRRAVQPCSDCPRR